LLIASLKSCFDKSLSGFSTARFSNLRDFPFQVFTRRTILDVDDGPVVNIDQQVIRQIHLPGHVFCYGEIRAPAMSRKKSDLRATPGANSALASCRTIADLIQRFRNGSLHALEAWLLDIVDTSAFQVSQLLQELLTPEVALQVYQEGVNLPRSSH
jgi:hypothetical protein